MGPSDIRLLAGRPSDIVLETGLSPDAEGVARALASDDAVGLNGVPVV